MTPRQKQIEILILTAMIKMVSEQSTRLQNELSRDVKQSFNRVVQPCDYFIRTIERDINDFDKETFELLTDSMHDGIKGLRKQLFEHLEITGE